MIKDAPKTLAILAVLVLLWSLSIFFSTLELSDQYSLDQRSQDNDVESSSPPQCSYELLYKAFRHRTDTMKKSDDEEATEQPPRDCWRPEDEVLQIPVDAILNRHEMDGIGAGSKGGVYQAIIQLDETDSTEVCIAALKTEECRPMERGTLREEKNNDDDWISCVDPSARSWDESDMNKEFMGAFVFVAARKAGIMELPGIIPTWGLVVNKENPSTIVGANIVYPSVVGTIMPLKKFKTFTDLAEEDPYDHYSTMTTTTRVLPKDSVGFAKIMLPAAEALLFMKRLGMSFQDIRAKNIGVSTTIDKNQEGNSAFVYDNTFLSFLEGATCSLDGDYLSEGCNFCNKESLTQQHRYEGTTRESIVSSDCTLFAWHVETLMQLFIPQEKQRNALISYRFRKRGTCQLEDIVARWQTIIKTN
jgi:hypothetical protein